MITISEFPWFTFSFIRMKRGSLRVETVWSSPAAGFFSIHWPVTKFNTPFTNNSFYIWLYSRSVSHAVISSRFDTKGGVLLGDKFTSVKKINDVRENCVRWLVLMFLFHFWWSFGNFHEFGFVTAFFFRTEAVQNLGDIAPRVRHHNSQVPRENAKLELNDRRSESRNPLWIPHHEVDTNLDWQKNFVSVLCHWLEFRTMQCITFNGS